MTSPNIFTLEVSEGAISRITHLKPESTPLWGKMTVDQMLAHCCVAYEMVYENIHPKPNFFKQLMLRLFVKNLVVGPSPYPRNAPTAPAFKIVERKNFDYEQKRLIDYIRRTAALGIKEFEGKESNSFGKLSGDEWNTMFYKHLDHHLRQFNV
ncbi:hypothetical protein GCM10023091_12860 [Ravibacter arvi]|uniref:DUF1569 domain-containing protein n=1 Tax=Ravibacter arvi TaxID=2051041 RepID=A0ABP8LUJ8_9BACT